MLDVLEDDPHERTGLKREAAFSIRTKHICTFEADLLYGGKRKEVS